MWPFKRRTSSVTPSTDADRGESDAELRRTVADLGLTVEGLLERESTRAARERQRRRRDQSGEGGVASGESPAVDATYDVGAGPPNAPQVTHDRVALWREARAKGMA